jgi:hypothetical protein
MTLSGDVVTLKLMQHNRSYNNPKHQMLQNVSLVTLWNIDVLKLMCFLFEQAKKEKKKKRKCSGQHQIIVT